jgi:hypothetical protein
MWPEMAVVAPPPFSTGWYYQLWQKGALLKEPVGTGPVRPVPDGTGPARYLNRSGSHLQTMPTN